jgi:endonuclease/exonuclease/phosphatase family metal-dependent hydrolase
MGDEAYKFVEFPWRVDVPDVRRERLCRGGSGDPIRIDCALEGASFVPAPVPPRDEIVLMAYNLERGMKAEAQVEALLADGSIPRPDVILVSEADRGCTRTDYKDITRGWAKAMAMNYVYGTEFIELPRLWGPAGGRMRGRCEHGNAILSRYPIGNVRLIRHASNISWYSWWQRLFRVGEPRLGGRMALAADVKVGEKILRLYSVHFESKGGNEPFRGGQAAELAEDALSAPAGAVIGGDMNSGAYLADLREGTKKDSATLALFARGYADAHARLAPDDRITTRSGVVIDLLFGRGVQFLEAGIGAKEWWGGLSDHLPVWAKLRLA